MAEGDLEGERVIVRDEREASTLQNKGAYGVPQRGGALELDLLETLYLMEQGRLSVSREGARLGAEEVVTLATARAPDFVTRYVVYRDLRQRTYVVRASGVADFNVFPPGSLPGKSASKTLVRAVSERAALRPREALDLARRANELGKRAVVGIVDEEGDLTYYEVQMAEPRGKTPANPARFSGAGALVSARVVVFDAAVAKRLHEEEFYGRPSGAGLQLGLTEALYLAEAGGLLVELPGSRARVDPEALRTAARALQPDFDVRYAAYRDLKARDLVVKTGFKFGTHFRAYPRGPDEGHAPFIIHALDPAGEVPWPEVAGFVRVAHGVRKRMLFAVAGAYLELTWTKP